MSDSRNIGRLTALERILVLIAFTALTALGGWFIVSGRFSGLWVVGFFMLGLLFLIIEPWLPKPKVSPRYRLVITNNEIVCEYPKRTESIRWEDVARIWYITTSDGPWSPDEWLLFIGSAGYCSIPTEAAGFGCIWDELKQRFPDFDYEAIVKGGTDDAEYLCWERKP
jgi:hypothetical protein